MIKIFIELPLELGCVTCTGINGTCNCFGRICESRGLSNLTPARSRLFKLIGRVGVEDIDLRVTCQEGPGYSYGRCQKPGAKLEDGGPEMGLRPGYGLRPVVTIIIW